MVYFLPQWYVDVDVIREMSSENFTEHYLHVAILTKYM